MRSALVRIAVVAGATLIAAVAFGASNYDKEATDMVLQRAARQVKDHCGQAKDEDGKAIGPWGKTKVSVTLGHNGRSKEPSVPPPFDGKPTGRCAAQAFSNLQFPPWSGPDVPIEWDVELVQPTPEEPVDPPKKKNK